MTEALFVADGESQVVPTDLARGPWSPDALHGGPSAALLGRTAEPFLDGMHPARVTVELLRPVPVAPLVARADVVRPGRKVRLVRATLARAQDGLDVATATVLGIRLADVELPRTGHAAERPGQPPDPEPPPPPSTGRPPSDVNGPAATSDHPAFHSAGVEHRFVVGDFGAPGPATDWIRLRVPVVAGQPTTPLQRVLAAADFGNGISGIANFAELTYINPDLTVYLHRQPVGEWVCLDAVSRLEPVGVGLAESELWDEEGRIGRSLQSLLVEPRST